MTSAPPLSWWSHVWRYSAVAIIAGVAWGQLATWQWDHQRWWFWLDLGVGLLAVAMLPWRRRFPVTVAVVTNLMTIFSASAGGAATLALVSLATRRRWREVIPVGVLAFFSGITFEHLNPTSKERLAIDIPLVILVIAVTVGWGMYIGSRRELLATLRERAETAEAEQVARMAQARAAERSRIAREMHDVLAHRISLVTMHAGALTFRDDLSAEQIRTTASIIQDNAHQAMVELREVLGILRDGPGDAAPERPQPGALDLPDLLAEAREAGMKVTDSRTINLDVIPVALGRATYRVVQEGLTNARKHASDTLVSIRISGDPETGLLVEVRNPMPIGSNSTTSPASGLGLVGLAERTELAGGKLSHRVSPDRHFELRAWLPWPT